MNSGPTPLLRLNNVSKRFGDDNRLVAAVVNASVEIRCGETVALVGPSGSGKTTLLQVAAGLISPTEGRVDLLGAGISTYSRTALQQTRAQRVGFVFQTCRLLDALNVIDNIALAARFAGRKTAPSRAEALGLLRDIGIEHLARAYPFELSQGEKQRVAAARALINQPDLIFADEPTASLESSQGNRLMQLLSEYVHKHRAGMLLATHDLRLMTYADRVLRIEDGRVVEIRGDSAATGN